MASKMAEWENKPEKKLNISDLKFLTRCVFVFITVFSFFFFNIFFLYKDANHAEDLISDFVVNIFVYVII